MYKKKSFFITFEGVEGSGKSYHSLKLFKKLKKNKFSVLLTREPGGTKSSELIRDLILEDYFQKDSKEKFNKYTDTLLYLASRNEHVENVIKPAINKKKIIICDRFVDSTLAYQVYGKNIDKRFIDYIHSYILKDIRPDLTFILYSNISKALKRLNKRKKKNRYDKFSKKFYNKVQNSFIEIGKKNKSRYVVLDNSHDSPEVEKIIYDKFLLRFKK
jgi:dTMP kinase